MKSKSHTSSSLTSKAAKTLAGRLTPGRVYRREDLSAMSGAVDRDISELMRSGNLKKLARGLYHVPKKSRFGTLPPDDSQLVRAFLKDSDFLVFSPSTYNTLGVGTTQLYDSTVVYNHKRHGDFKLGERMFSFKVKPRFPKKLSPEFLFVDLLSNIGDVAEDTEEVLKLAQTRVKTLDAQRLEKAMQYGSVSAKKKLKAWLHA